MSIFQTNCKKKILELIKYDLRSLKIKLIPKQQENIEKKSLQKDVRVLHGSFHTGEYVKVILEDHRTAKTTFDLKYIYIKRHKSEARPLQLSAA